MILVGLRLSMCLILDIDMDGVIPLLELERMRMIDWAAVRWSFAATCRASCPRLSPPREHR
jgi:hypothetical protein